jgi:hypothetical protein
METIGFLFSLILLGSLSIGFMTFTTIMFSELLELIIQILVKYRSRYQQKPLKKIEKYLKKLF